MLTNLHELAIHGPVSIDPLEGDFIALRGSDRIAVLHADGSLSASSSFPGLGRLPHGLVWVGPVSASGGLIAFAVAEPERERTFGYENVYLLRAGDSTARLLLRVHLGTDECGHTANLTWHDGWLLYWTPEARVMLIDPADPGAVVDLSGLANRLPGVIPDGDGYVPNFAVSWAT